MLERVIALTESEFVMRSSTRYESAIAFLVLVAVLDAPLRAEQLPIPAAQIAAGQSLWVDSQPGDALLNARVDIGAMRQNGDEIEVSLRWQVSPGFVIDLRLKEPDLQVPPQSVIVDRERVVCKAHGMLSYALESTIVAPDGTRIREKKYDPVVERKREESRSGDSDGYHPNPRSLVCWAAARKCEGKPFTWPPPPDKTPLEHSARASAMRTAYDREFVPSCRL